MRWNKSLALVAVLLIGAVVCSEKVSVEKEKSAAISADLIAEASKESAPAEPIPETAASAEPLAAESRVIGDDKVFAANLKPTFIPQGAHPTYPVYRHPHDMQAAASTYRGPRPGPQFQTGPQMFRQMNPAAAVQFQNQPIQPQAQNSPLVKNIQQQQQQQQKVVHKKEEHPKKPTHKSKPQYYPKESSYAVIPDQPMPNTPRFVPDPSRNQIIETISPAEMLSMQHQPNPFPMMQQPHGPHMGPHFNAGGPMGPQGGPFMGPHGGMGPQFHHGAGGPGNRNHHHMNRGSVETSTIRYEQTEHGFMDRMWGEVMTVRRTMSDNLFVGIPNLFRRFWHSIVGAVSATSRMFTGASDDEEGETLNEFTSRMLEWVPLGYSIFESIMQNLNY